MFVAHRRESVAINFIRFGFDERSTTEPNTDRCCFAILGENATMGCASTKSTEIRLPIYFSIENDFGVFVFSALKWWRSRAASIDSFEWKVGVHDVDDFSLLLLSCISIRDQFMLATHRAQSRQWCRQPQSISQWIWCAWCVSSDWRSLSSLTNSV